MKPCSDATRNFESKDLRDSVAISVRGASLESRSNTTSGFSMRAPNIMDDAFPVNLGRVAGASWRR